MTRDEAPDGVVRLAQVEDVDAVLDLLTEYDLPRSYFEPFYRADPTYDPAQSLLVDVHGRLVAHLRIFDRTLRIGGVPVRIGGVGNVITARAARGRGYAARLLAAAVTAMAQAGYAYSLLWTHLPALYARAGWTLIEQEVVEAVLPPPDRDDRRIAPFSAAHLPVVVAIYNATNALRTGPVVRSDAYWRGQLAWLREEPGQFLVGYDTAGTVSGYVRSRREGDTVALLELGLADGSVALGRALLCAAAAAADGALIGRLPPSLQGLFRADEATLVPDPGLMGRVVQLPALVTALSPRWCARLRAAEHGAGVLPLALHGGATSVRLSLNEAVVTEPSPDATAAPPLDEAAFAQLLFHGFDQTGEARYGTRPDASLLRLLFPPQDLVIWEADAF